MKYSFYLHFEVQREIASSGHQNVQGHYTPEGRHLFSHIVPLI